MGRESRTKNQKHQEEEEEEKEEELQQTTNKNNNGSNSNKYLITTAVSESVWWSLVEIRTKGTSLLIFKCKIWDDFSRKIKHIRFFWGRAILPQVTPPRNE